MKNSGWNPIRRNRNIGTAKSGVSQNNKLTIPLQWRDYRVYWERLKEAVVCPLVINGHKLTMFVERPRLGYIHACTPQDIIKVLKCIPTVHLEEIEVFVLRQPTKKEAILGSCWGRFVYYADLGKFSGSGVYLEAQKDGKIFEWGKGLSPFYMKELQALEDDGHQINKVKRGYEIATTSESIRNTQLFRTIPHEIGHAMDYLLHSLEPQIEADTVSETNYIRKVFDAKPSQDKEEYANRYAKEFYIKHSATGELPFLKIFDEDALIEMGLDPEWFTEGKS